MVDGDGTYPAESAPLLIARIQAGADMVIGTRLQGAERGRVSDRPFVGQSRVHRRRAPAVRYPDARPVLGLPRVDTPIAGAVAAHRAGLRDRNRALDSGVRQSVPRRRGAGRLWRPHRRQPIEAQHDSRRLPHRDRDPRVLSRLPAAHVVWIRRRCCSFAASIATGSLVIQQYLATGQVLRIPLAICAAGLFILSALSMTAGVLLSSINRRAEEIRSLLVSKWS